MSVLKHLLALENGGLLLVCKMTVMTFWEIGTVYMLVTSV